MKNTLGDLNNHLFAQLERLSDEDQTPEQLSVEIARSRALTGLASQIIQNGSLVLKAKVAISQDIEPGQGLPKMLEG